MVFEFVLWTQTHSTKNAASEKEEIKTQSQYAFKNWTYRSPICDKSAFFLRRSGTSRTNKPEEAIEMEEKKRMIGYWTFFLWFEPHLIRLALSGYILNDCGTVCANEDCLSNVIKVFMNETTWHSGNIPDKKCVSATLSLI